MTGEQALNALAERVAVMRSHSRAAAYEAQHDKDEARRARRMAEGAAFTRVLSEIAELRKKL